MTQQNTIRNFDHASATPLDPAVHTHMCELLGSAYANPGGVHQASKQVRTLITDARTTISRICGVSDGGVIFTASATESDNLALIGAVRAFTKKYPNETPHVVVSAIEHSAILEAVSMLKTEGTDVSFVPVSEEGLVDPAAVKEVLTENTVIVSVMYANNEVGTIQPIAEIGQIVRQHRRHRSAHSDYPYFHTDATQAAAYLPLSLQEMKADLMTINGSKVYGPRGIGALICKPATDLAPILYGGKQEFGLRPGTPNAPAISGFAMALQRAQKGREKEAERLRALQTYCFSALEDAFAHIEFHGSRTSRLVNNVAFTIPGIEAELLLIELDTRGVLASAKSACKDDDPTASHVLKALYGDKTPDEGAVRLSMGHATTKEDVTYVVQALKDIVAIHIPWQKDTLE